MSPSPLISFIVPFYNNEDYIVASLGSLFDQITADVEVVIIDDGSTDNSAHLVTQYLATHSELQIKFIRQSNGGIAHARNIGLANATGRYITFLDGDDLLHSQYLDILRPILLSGEYELIDFNYQKFSQFPPALDTVDKIQLEEYDFNTMGLDCLTPLFANSMWHLWSRVYKRSLLVGESFATGRRYEDVIFTPFLYFKTQKIAHLEHILYFYRDNSQGITRNIKAKDIEDMLFAVDKIIDVARQHDEQLQRLAALMIINCCANVKSMTKALYGYYRYDSHTLHTFRNAAVVCQGTSVPTKKIWQLRYPQVDTWLSKIRWQLKKRELPA